MVCRSENGHIAKATNWALEMAVKTLRSIPAYVEHFKKAFPGEKDVVTFENIARAIDELSTRNLIAQIGDGDNGAQRLGVTPAGCEVLARVVRERRRVGQFDRDLVGNPFTAISADPETA